MESSVTDTDRILNVPPQPGYKGSQVTWVMADLQTWGWTEEDTTNEEVNPLDFSDEGILPISSVLNQLHISTVLSGYDGGPNYQIEQIQQDEVTVDGVTYPTSQGQYISAFNIHDGVIYQIDNLSPSQTTAHPLVELSRWSDVVFLEWSRLAGNNLQNINYIFAYFVSNTESQQIVARAVQGHGNLGPWPGISFFPGQDEYQAVVGSPNGFGVAWFLISHKYWTLFKTISEVVVFTVEDSDRDDSLFILFKITSVN
ncbi:MAG: hypothetical protein M1821_005101 [Bathelium mastoideum]|nr:MAG: hypothetical protein M1821_005101 [Bathelium mastoideum]